MPNQNYSKPTIIVGAGTVGLMLAHELVSRGEKVVIIEAGNETLNFFNTSEFKSIGKTHAGVQYGRAKAVGGTSNLWGGQLTEFISDDFECNNSFNQPEWIVDWNTIQKYYSRVYEKLNFTPKIPSIPETLIEDKNLNESLEIFYSRWIKQPNFKFQFWEYLTQSKNVSIITNAVVVDLEFDKETCCLLKYFKDEQLHEMKDFKNVVLANGSIEIIRLLLHLKSNKTVPFSNNNNIGFYFQDHPNFKVGEVLNTSKELLNKFSNFFTNGEKLQPKLRLKPIISNKENYIGVCGFFSYESNVSDHIYMFKQFAKSILGQSKEKVKFKDMVKMFFKLIPATPHIFKIMFTYLKNNKIYIPFNSKVKLIINSQQISYRDSYVTVSDKEFEKNGLPKVIVNWQIDGREFDAITNFCDLLGSYLVKNKLGTLQFDDWFLQVNEKKSIEWVNKAGDVYHQAGGAIMSKTPESGVVDEDLKLHNTENVFICGASVMPTSSYGNITLTALALTLRLADFLMNDNRN